MSGKQTVWLSSLCKDYPVNRSDLQRRPVSWRDVVLRWPLHRTPGPRRELLSDGAFPPHTRRDVEKSAFLMSLDAVGMIVT